MGRIPPNRTGYLVYACTGIVPHLVPPMDCLGPNCFQKMPPEMVGGMSDMGWEDLSPLDDDVRLIGYTTTCGLNFDPFEGIAIDLYLAFLDDGLGGYIEDECYTELLPRYATGYSRAKPMFNLTGACGRE